MQFYIIKKGIEYVIFKVKDDDVLQFKETHRDQILVEANSLMQLLLLFEQEIMFSLDHSGN